MATSKPLANLMRTACSFSISYSAGTRCASWKYAVEVCDHSLLVDSNIVWTTAWYRDVTHVDVGTVMVDLAALCISLQKKCVLRGKPTCWMVGKNQIFSFALGKPSPNHHKKWWFSYVCFRIIPPITSRPLSHHSGRVTKKVRLGRWKGEPIEVAFVGEPTKNWLEYHDRLIPLNVLGTRNVREYLSCSKSCLIALTGWCLVGN